MRKLLIFFIILLLSSCALPEISPTQPLPSQDFPTALPAATNTLPPTETLETTEAVITPKATEAATSTPAPETSPGIILFIGDGMGTIQRQAATWLGLGENGVLAMDAMPVRGSAITSSANNEVTDSAAASTALATGQLTNNQFLGVNSQKELLVTILELAQNQGWSVGLVTTTQLTHATPAAFAVHHPSRDDTLIIARQMMEKQVDVLLGGGEDDFFSRGEDGCFTGNGRQPKGADLVALAIGEGYSYVCSAEQLAALEPSQTNRVLGLFAGGGMESPYSPTLSEMTQTAIDILSQDPDGFFLMVEGGQIDWAGHDRDAEKIIQDTLSLDAAVTIGQTYALGHPETLVIVTADHETGGMKLNKDGAGSLLQDGPFLMPDGTAFWVDWNLIKGHTSQLIPVTAQGPFSENLSGEFPLTKIFETMTLMLFSH